MTSTRILTAGDLCPELHFDTDRHVYTLDGEVRPGITRIFKDLNLVDTSFFTEEMRAFGVMRHLVTELDDLGDLHEPSVDPRLIPTLHGWREWRRRKRFVPTHVEVRVYSDFGYATIIDRVGFFEDRPEETVVINLKGPAKLPSYPVQLAAETRAFEERTGTQVAKRLSVHISRDGETKDQEHRDHDDLSTWIAMLSVWRWRERNLR